MESPLRGSPHPPLTSTYTSRLTSGNGHKNLSVDPDPKDLWRGSVLPHAVASKNFVYESALIQGAQKPIHDEIFYLDLFHLRISQRHEPLYVAQPCQGWIRLPLEANQHVIVPFLSTTVVDLKAPPEARPGWGFVVS